MMTRSRSILAVFAAAVAASLLSGCAAGPSADRASPPPLTVASLSAAQAALPSAAACREVLIWRRGGSSATWTDVLASIADAEAVFIGETHGHPLGTAWAATLWEDLLAMPSRDGFRPALSLEFFERDDQSRIDDYLAGLGDEQVFLRRTERSSGNYPPAHRRMLEASKASGRAVFAANAPWQMIRGLRGRDYAWLAGLTPEQQRLYRIPPSLIGGRYRSDFENLMSGIKPGAEAQPGGAAGASERTPEQQARLDGSYRAQQLWDWTMADTAVRALAQGHRPVVTVVGRFHSDFTGGLPQAMSQLRPGARIVTISMVDEPPLSPPALKPADRDRADFVIYVGPSPAN
jgi:uncharacterized iron-regulated protein